MIRRWVFEGRLEDPHDEFFVRGHPSLRLMAGGGAAGVAGAAAAAAGGIDLWRQGYWIEERRLLPFITHDTAAAILRAGKSINFLTAICDDGRWAQERAAEALATAGPLINYAQRESLGPVVEQVGSQVDGRVMELLRGRFGLSKHFDAVRRYLLLGQGDFVQVGATRTAAATWSAWSEGDDKNRKLTAFITTTIFSRPCHLTPGTTRPPPPILAIFPPFSAPPPPLRLAPRPPRADAGSVGPATARPFAGRVVGVRGVAEPGAAAGCSRLQRQVRRRGGATAAEGAEAQGVR